MININYKIGVETIEDSSLNALLNETGPFQSIKNYSSLDGIRLTVQNSDLISNAFKRHSVKQVDVHKRDGYVVKQTDINSNLRHKINNFDILELSSISYKEFIQKFGRYIIGKVDDKLPSGISTYDQIRVVEIKDEVVTKLEKDLYGLSIDHGRVYVDTILNTENLYVLLFRDVGKIIKVDNNFDISNEKLLSLSSGFYQILPKYYHSTKELYTSKSKGQLTLQAEDVVKVVSDMYVNLDGCTTNSFILQPGLEVLVKYEQDYTPLTEVKSFWEDKEYIIFKIEENTLSPLYHITSSGEDPTEGYKQLMQSHHEFLRNYVVISDKASMLKLTTQVAEDELDNLLQTSEETFTVENTYFKTVLEKIPNLIKIKVKV